MNVTPPALIAAKLKTLRDFERFARGGHTQPQFPMEVFLEISNICDLQCAMCHMFSGINVHRQAIVKSQKRGFMDLDVLSGKLDSVLERALLVHAFGYGEPTLHPHFPELLQYLGRFGVMVDFFTHGNHLDAPLCDLLVRYGVASITLSASGASPDDYENVYLGGDHRKLMQALTRLEATRRRMRTPYPRMVVNSIGFRHHVLRLPEFVEKMAAVGVSHIDLKPLTLTEAIQALDQHAADPQSPDVRAAIERAKAVARRRNVRLDTSAFECTPLPASGTGPVEEMPITLFPQMAKSAEHKRAMREQSREVPELVPVPWSEVKFMRLPEGAPPCLEPFKTLYLAQTGNAYPCCFKNDPVMLGNIRDASLQDIWQGEVARSMREHIVRGEYPAQLCVNCIRNNLYPKNHSLDGITLVYSTWLQLRQKRHLSRLLEMRARIRSKYRTLANINQNQAAILRHQEKAAGR